MKCRKQLISKVAIIDFQNEAYKYRLIHHRNVDDATLLSDQGHSMVTVRVHYPAVSPINPPPFIHRSQICLHQSSHHLEPRSLAQPCEGT